MSSSARGRPPQPRTGSSISLLVSLGHNPSSGQTFPVQPGFSAVQPSSEMAGGPSILLSGSPSPGLSSSPVQLEPVSTPLALVQQFLTHCWTLSISWCPCLSPQVWECQIHTPPARGPGGCWPLVFLERALERESWRDPEIFSLSPVILQRGTGCLDSEGTFLGSCMVPGWGLDPSPPLSTSRTRSSGVRWGEHLRGT